MGSHSCKFSHLSLEVWQSALATVQCTSHFSLTALQNVPASQQKELSFYLHQGVCLPHLLPLPVFPCALLQLAASLTLALGKSFMERLFGELQRLLPFHPLSYCSVPSKVSWHGLQNGDQGGSRTAAFPQEAICVVALACCMAAALCITISALSWSLPCVRRGAVAPGVCCSHPASSQVAVTSPIPPSLPEIRPQIKACI